MIYFVWKIAFPIMTIMTVLLLEYIVNHQEHIICLIMVNNEHIITYLFPLMIYEKHHRVLQNLSHYLQKG